MITKRTRSFGYGRGLAALRASPGLQSRSCGLLRADRLTPVWVSFFRICGANCVRLASPGHERTQIRRGFGSFGAAWSQTHMDQAEGRAFGAAWSQTPADQAGIRVVWRRAVTNAHGPGANSERLAPRGHKRPHSSRARGSSGAHGSRTYAGGAQIVCVWRPLVANDTNRTGVLRFSGRRRQPRPTPRAVGQQSSRQSAGRRRQEYGQPDRCHSAG